MYFPNADFLYQQNMYKISSIINDIFRFKYDVFQYHISVWVTFNSITYFGAEYQYRKFGLSNL